MKKELKFGFGYCGSFAAMVENAKFYLEHRTKLRQDFIDFVIADGQPFTMKLTVSISSEHHDKALDVRIDVYDRPIGEGGSVMLEHAFRPMTLEEFSEKRVMTAIRGVAKRSETLLKLMTL